MRTLIRFELGQIFRAPAWWVLLGGCLLFGIMVPIEEMGPGMRALDADATYRIQYYVICSSMMVPAVLLVCLPLTVLRDASVGFEAVTHCLPQRARFWSQWIAVTASIWFCLAAVPIGLAVGFAIKDGVSPSRLAGSVALPFLSTGLINGVICTNIAIWICLRWKHAASPFLTALGLTVLFWVSQIVCGMPVLGGVSMVDPLTRQIAALIDPFGVAPFFEATRYWTTAMKNASAFPIATGMIVHRAVWLALSLVFLRLVIVAQERPLDGRVRGCAEDTEPLSTVRVVDRLTAFSGRLASSGGFPRVFRMDCRAVLRSGPFACAIALWLVLTTIGMLMVFGTFSEGTSPRLPSTSLMLSYMGEPFFFFGSLFAIVFSTLILWRDRRVGMEEILDGLPVGNGISMTSKLVSLMLVFAAMVAVMILVGLVCQLWIGYRAIDYGHWLAAFYTFGLPLAVHGTVVFAVQVLCFSRNCHPLTAMVAGASVSIGLRALPVLTASHGPLAAPFHFPDLLRQHSEIRGYGVWGAHFDQMALLWGAWLVPLLILVRRSWPRAEGRRSGWRWGLASSVLVALAVTAWTAGRIDRERPYSDHRVEGARADYERRYGHLSNEEVPQIVHTDNRLDLFPEKRLLAVESHNRVVNTTSGEITRLLITARQPLTTLELGIPFERRAHDPVVHATLIEFARPWRVGETISLTYQTKLTSTPFAIEPGLGNQSSYVLQARIEPVLGYYEGLELREPSRRARLGLPAKTFRREDRHTRYGRFIHAKRTMTTRFTTSADQTPLTSGVLTESTVRGERRMARFVSQQPIYPVIGYFSGSFENHQLEAEGVPVTIYHHPGHDANLETIVEAVRATVGYCTRHFGPYPYPSLSIVEIPATFRTGGRASAGVIALNERGLFMLDPDPGDSVHTVVRRTVHEVAHQWFGEKMVPEIAHGEGVLTESLTKYVEAMVVARMLGPEMVEKINRTSRHRYFSGRSRDGDEAPLIAANEYYLVYGKGGLVFQQLASVLGEAPLNGLLRSFMARHQTGMTATMTGLVEHLMAGVDEAHRGLVRDLFYRRTTHELSLTDVTVVDGEQSPALLLEIRLEAADRDAAGNPIKVTPNLPLVIGFRPASIGSVGVLIEGRSGSYRIEVDRLPDTVILDPLGIHLESNRADNVYHLTGGRQAR